MAGEFEKALLKSLTALHISLPADRLAALSRYYGLLREWNSKISLTALTDPLDMAEKLFADSLFLLKFLHNRETLLDLGSGAGFPGLALKIAKPELTVHLVDSVRKKVSFLKQVILELGLLGVEASHARLGEPSPDAPPQRFDAVTFRAVGPIRELSGLVLPYLEPGGFVLAMKGPHVENEELDSLDSSLTVREIVRYTLPQLSVPRSVVILEKAG